MQGVPPLLDSVRSTGRSIASVPSQSSPPATGGGRAGDSRDDERQMAREIAAENQKLIASMQPDQATALPLPCLDLYQRNLCAVYSYWLQVLPLWRSAAKASEGTYMARDQDFDKPAEAWRAAFHVIRFDKHKAVQVEKAKEEIRERLDPSILAFLEKRAAQRKAQHVASNEASASTQVTGYITPSWHNFLGR